MAKKTITVVDFGSGNLRSVVHSLKAADTDASVLVSSDPGDIANASRIVLPGQGAMPAAMAVAGRDDFRSALEKAVSEKPVLGICIGLQMLFDESEEGNTAGLGFVKGRVVRFNLDGRLRADGSRYKIPHMGWNGVKQQKAHPLWAGITDGAAFYFVHSYYAAPENASDVAGLTVYGDAFCSAIAKGSLFATQFHPEKSGENGLKLYRNFINWNL